MKRFFHNNLALFTLAMLPALILHFLLFQPTEPFFNNDETRHLMTGVFFHDFFISGDWLHPQKFAINYYVQYPALGLLVWPPGLHILEGLWFTIVGVSYPAARLLIELCFVGACWQLFSLIRLKQTQFFAASTVGLFSLMPLIAPFSRHVMGEVPTLFLVLGSILHIEKSLMAVAPRRRDLWLACTLAALAALTRFDAVFLIPYAMGRVLLARHWALFRQKHFYAACAFASLLTGPYYAFTWKEYGQAASHAATQGTGTQAQAAPFFGTANLGYYPSVLPDSAGWALTLAALAGLAIMYQKEQRKLAAPFLVLIAAVYITFTPLAELEARHAIYGLPAWAYLATLLIHTCIKWVHCPIRQGIYAFVGVFMLAVFTFWETNSRHVNYVFGYAIAAQYVAQNSENDQRILMDAFLNGGFIYDIRRLAHAKNLTVLRGDKLFYGMLSDPNGGYKDHTNTIEQTAQLIYELDPEYIVIEQPLLRFSMPGAQRLRETISHYPDRFVWVKTVPIISDRALFENARLEIYRNIYRNPEPKKMVEIPMLNLGRSLEKR
jgi:hypothetical protein